MTHGGALSKAEMPAATEAFEKMKANVADIAAPVEKERWQANRDLWQAMLDRPGTK